MPFPILPPPPKANPITHALLTKPPTPIAAATIIKAAKKGHPGAKHAIKEIKTAALKGHPAATLAANALTAALKAPPGAVPLTVIDATNGVPKSGPSTSVKVVGGLALLGGVAFFGYRYLNRGPRAKATRLAQLDAEDRFYGESSR